MRTQAPVGGCQGKNGEWYNGGEFLPSSEHTIKGAHKIETKPASRKVQIEPHKWEVCPAGMVAIYPQLAGIQIYNPFTETFCLNGMLNWEYLGGSSAIAATQERIEAYNRGERFIAINH